MLSGWSDGHHSLSTRVHGEEGPRMDFPDLLRVTDWELFSATELLEPLEIAIHSQLNPALTGHTPPNKLVWELLMLRAHLGGLGLINPKAISTGQHTTSKLISSPAVERVLCQDRQLAECHAIQQDLKARAHSNKRSKQGEEAKNIQSLLPVPLQCCIKLSEGSRA